MVVRYCVGMLIVLGVALLGGERAAAFCVYNKIAEIKGDDRVFAEITDGGTWEATIARGESQCCSWEDRRCNRTGQRGGMLSFRIISLQASVDSPRPCTIDIEAGGWIYVAVTRALVDAGAGTLGARRMATVLKCTEIRYKH
jgi:hypothetical protein